MFDLKTLMKSTVTALTGALLTALTLSNAFAAQLAIKDTPLFLNDTAAPLNMLVMGRDHRIYYEAYNDASDLDGDNILDTHYKTDATFFYFGYFDSKKCYSYDAAGLFLPVGPASGKKCTGLWSGDWLNYVTMSRIDALRGVLYGGLRSVDTPSQTVLQRSFIPQDAHSWGKEYSAGDGYLITDYTPLPMPAANTRHLFANTTPSADLPVAGNPNPAINGVGLPKMRVLLNRDNRIWEWVSKERPVAGTTVDNSRVGGGTNDGVTLDFDLYVRVRVCVSGLEEANCASYGTSKKPTGLLQDYGETDKMLFGLLTGSYGAPHEGGVMRKVVGSVKNEIDLSTGQFLLGLANPGIISSIDRLRVTGFNGDAYGCNEVGDARPDTLGACSMWGNPTAEMMYEVLRYFSGKNAPTTAFSGSASNAEEATLGLKLAAWNDPYAVNPSCAKPFETVISDINPSFDSDKVPQSSFGGFAGDVAGLNATTLGNTIWDHEIGAPGRYFIGDNSSPATDGAPTPKIVSSFANIRGLSPEGPTREGSYNAASVAYYGLEHDLNGAAGDQKLQTFSVALASPLPQFKIQVGGGEITFVPFAKSVRGGAGGGFSAAIGAYQATDQIVDFYVESITPTSGRFRVNYEDVEQGSDHDMDAIAIYEYQVKPDNSVDITVTSEYAAGGIVQHMGYVISGSDHDGTYLEVRDRDTDPAGDPDYFLDTPPGVLPGGNYQDNVALPLGPQVRNFKPSNGTSAGFLKDPLWYAAKYGSFTDTNRTGFPDAPSKWDADGNGVPDNYFLVTNAVKLKDQLTKAFNSIINNAGSFSSASVNSGSISSATRIYQAKFSSQHWNGQLLAFPISSAGVLGGLDWDASVSVPAFGARTIITANSTLDGNNVYSTGVPFEWTNLDGTRQAELQPSDSAGPARLDYLRGKVDPSFRVRDSSLGDIINSAPVYVGAPAFRYLDSMETAPYSAFRTAVAGREPMVYAGANDGMLHGFDANSGIEKFAFIPASVFRNLYKLSDPGYAHQYFVDGSPTVIDAFYAGAWHTVLATGLNKGGQGIFALDVTRPQLITQAGAANTLLWEFSDRSDPDMGFSFSRPAIVKMKNGKWAAVFGNGYNNSDSQGGTDVNVSTTGHAVLFIVDIQTGAVIKKIDTLAGTVGTPNGLATPLMVDADADGVTEYAYAGDLLGNMWKFDLSDTSPTNWDVAYQSGGTPAPLYVARDSSNRRQPITERPAVAFGPNGSGFLILFGTGKFLEQNDRDLASLKPQSFYGIYDENSGVGATDIVPGRSALIQQTIVQEKTVTAGKVRITSKNPVDPATDHGWYIDLVSPSGFDGEMQITDPLYRNGRVIFTTLIPDTDICAYGGKSWLMEMDALTGSMLNYPPLDLNNNDKFDDEVISGLQSDSITARPAVLADPPGNIERKVMTNTAGGVEIKGENPGPGAYNRQSWRQVR